MGKKSCVSDGNKEDEVQAKMLTWLFHISEGEKKRIQLLPRSGRDEHRFSSY